MMSFNWYDESAKGKNCYMIGCGNMDITKCPDCKYFFCTEHHEEHSHDKKAVKE